MLNHLLCNHHCMSKKNFQFHLNSWRNYGNCQCHHCIHLYLCVKVEENGQANSIIWSVTLVIAWLLVQCTYWVLRVVSLRKPLNLNVLTGALCGVED